MNNILETLSVTVKGWSDRAHASGWIDQSSCELLQSSSDQSPASLFDNSEAVIMGDTPADESERERPLVVAFFGGTGVGKSTLLNRLAGQDIALASAQRPTSREITLYLHNSIKLGRLPKELPVDKIRQATHNNERHRSVLWIDMPDFDSAEVANRALVDDWLPHIDALVYVVSPERYKDDQGWRLLLEHAKRHAWIFVINHWDRGNQVQREDFKRILADAGLPQPMLFCTDCGPGTSKPNGDEFEQFDNTVCDLSDQLIIKQLEERGILVRIRETKEQVKRTVSGFNGEKALDDLHDGWQSSWQQESSDIAATLDWKYKLLAAPFAELDKGLFKSLIDAIARRNQTQANDAANLKIDASQLLEDNIRTRVAIALDELPQQAANHGLPAAAIKNRIAPIGPLLDQHVATAVRQQLDQSLASPGTQLQRNLCKFLALLATLLPIAVIGWAGWKLITVFNQGNSAQQAYLGFDFATHTILLTALGWFLPWFLLQRFRPTKQAAAKRGMHNGILEAMRLTGKDVESAFELLSNERQQLVLEADNLFKQLPGTQTEPAGAAVNPALSRVLVAEQAVSSEPG